MPNAPRRQLQARIDRVDLPAMDVDAVSDDGQRHVAAGIDADHGEDTDADAHADADSGTGEGGEEAQDLDYEDLLFPPPGLKEISSLASWTVSTAKPGNGVAALRSPDTGQFWQSDGPQPHLLSIHFFKLVSIVHMRIFLDFENDESYTPTKIQFLAGMGVYDMIEFAEMSFEQPTGWIDVDFSNVGPILDDDDGDGEEKVSSGREIDWSKRPALRAFLVQIKILENHQNGKDTHLRGVQLFARDETQEVRRGNQSTYTLPTPKVQTSQSSAKTWQSQTNNIKLAPWMMEPDLR